MTNVNSSVIQNFLHFTITQVVPKIVADGYDNHVFLKLFSFELSHLHSSKLSFSIILPQNELIGNFATEPKDIPVSSSVRGFQIWTVEPTGDNEFNVTYSVDQLITEGENTKTVHSAYIVSVYVDGSGNMVLVKNPTITNIPKKSSYKPKAIESEGTVDSITTNEINEFLTTFFKLYPTATASELSYYVNDGILKPIGKEYIFQELVNPIHNRKDNQVTVSLTVEYIDQQTKATQVSQFDLVLEKNGSNWKIVK